MYWSFARKLKLLFVPMPKHVKLFIIFNPSLSIGTLGIRSNCLFTCSTLQCIFTFWVSTVSKYTIPSTLGHWKGNRWWCSLTCLSSLCSQEPTCPSAPVQKALESPESQLLHGSLDSDFPDLSEVHSCTSEL